MGNTLQEQLDSLKPYQNWGSSFTNTWTGMPVGVDMRWAQPDECPTVNVKAKHNYVSVVMDRKSYMYDQAVNPDSVIPMQDAYLAGALVTSTQAYMDTKKQLNNAQSKATGAVVAAAIIGAAGLIATYIEKKKNKKLKKENQELKAEKY